MKKINKIAIIGAGVIGNLHAKVLGELDFDISCICDINLQKAKALKETCAPNADIYTDWKKMIDEAKPDVVHVCTPHYLHAEMVIGALSRDVNVLCEKPLCMSPEEIPLILAAEKASRAKLGVCHQNRYLSTNRFVKEYLSDKKVSVAHGSVVWRRDAKYYNSEEWRGTVAKEGGGVLINQALHTLDLMQWFCGMPEHALSSSDNLSLKGVIEVEDTISVIFDGEQPFSFFATNASLKNMPVGINLTLSNGEFINLFPEFVVIDGEVRVKNKQTKCLGKPCYGSGHQLLISDFYRCVEENDIFPIDGEEGAKVMKLIFAAYQSKGEKTKI